MLSGIIFDIKKYSIHDGPGIRTTVFFKGCPLRCWWCHNPESQSAQPELMLRPNRCIRCEICDEACPQNAVRQGNDADEAMLVTDREKCQVCGQCVEICYSGARELVGKRMTVDEVMREIEYDRLFYDQSGGGVTFSGGEPLTQPEFLVALLIACQKRELHTALDTSGYAAKRLIERITPLVDLFLYDLKLLDEELHLRYTGVSNQLILSNLRWLSVKGVNLKVRIPLIPGVNDEEVSLRQMGEFLVELPNPPEIEIMPYHAIGEAKYEGLGKAYRLPGLLSQTPEKIAHTVFIFQSYGLQVHNSAISQP